MHKSTYIIVFAVLLEGCAGAPPFDTPTSQPGLTVARVIEEINCEIFEGQQALNSQPHLNPNVPPFNQWVGAVTLSLEIDDSIGAGPSLSYIDPLKGVGTSFTFSSTGQLTGSRQRIYSQQYGIDLKKIRGDACSFARREGSNFDLEGNLGIAEVIQIGMKSFDRHDLSINYGIEVDESNIAAAPTQSSSKSQDSFGQTIQFSVIKGVSATGPLWTLTHFKGPGGLVGASRSDIHKVIISFAPPNPPSSQAVVLSGLSKKTGVAPAIAAAVQFNAAVSNNQSMQLQQLIPRSGM